PSVAAHRRGVHAPLIALPTSAELLRVGVDQLFPATVPRYAEAVVVPGYGREVEYRRHAARSVGPVSQEGERALLAVVRIDPIEAARVEIEGAERRIFPLHAVQLRQ